MNFGDIPLPALNVGEKKTFKLIQKYVFKRFEKKLDCNNRFENFGYFKVPELGTFEVPELGTFEWWILGLRLNPLFFLISR